jgi:hypothetical protein
MIWAGSIMNKVFHLLLGRSGIPPRHYRRYQRIRQTVEIALTEHLPVGFTKRIQTFRLPLLLRLFAHAGRFLQFFRRLQCLQQIVVADTTALRLETRFFPEVIVSIPHPFAIATPTFPPS